MTISGTCSSIHYILQCGVFPNIYYFDTVSFVVPSLLFGFWVYTPKHRGVTHVFGFYNLAVLLQPNPFSIPYEQIGI